MAINWQTSITNVNTTTERADITFNRVDTLNSNNNWSVHYEDAIIGTGPQRAALLSQVWSTWQTELANRQAASTFVDNLEQMANAQLETWESE